MRLAGAAFAIAGALAILGYLGYLLWTEVVLDSEAALVLKIAIPAGAAGLVFLTASVVKERLRVRGREGLDEVEP